MNQLDEPIEIEAYNPAWADVFRSTAKDIRAQLGKRILAIEHIGSTAVPGLRGKPVVDVMIGVEHDILQEEVLHPALIGYESLGESGVPGRLYFRKRKPHAINLHGVEYQGTLWADNILLREYLRAHPAEAERYGRKKDGIFEAGARTLLAYSDAKRVTIQDLLVRARAWNPQHQHLHHT